jgi:hypothetical protein
VDERKSMRHIAETNFRSLLQAHSRFFLFSNKRAFIQSIQIICTRVCFILLPISFKYTDIISIVCSISICSSCCIVSMYLGMSSNLSASEGRHFCNFYSSYSLLQLEVLQLRVIHLLTSAIILGNPPPFLQKDSSLISVLIAALLVHCSPWNLFLKLLEWGKPLALPILHFSHSLNCAFSMYNIGINGARFHENVGVSNSFMAAFLCAVLSGTGGGIWTSCLSLRNVNWQFKIPEQLINPSKSFKLTCMTGLLFSLTKRNMDMDDVIIITCLIHGALNYILKIYPVNIHSQKKKIKEKQSKKMK